MYYMYNIVQHMYTYIVRVMVHIYTGICDILSTELRVGFTMSSYAASEVEKDVDVCVSVVRGQLGTDITLQVDTVSGTAVGE